MKDIFKKLVVVILIAEARAVLQRYKPRVVAVTGSVGKTSTKDAIYAALSKTTHVRASQKSFNSEFGLPLTILGRPNAWNNPLRWIQNMLDGLLLLAFAHSYPEWLVLEVGADRPGDIQLVAQWLKVDVAVITRLPDMPVHVEFFDSPQQVVEEKAALISALKQDGTLVLFGDDAHVEDFKRRAGSRRVITFGFSPTCDVRAEDPRMLFEQGSETWPIGMQAQLKVGDASVPLIVVGALGAHMLMPALGAAAACVALGRDPLEVAEALRAYEPPPGRMHVIPGLKDTLIIDDTYNSSPAALEAALETLRVVKTRGRRIAVLGDMLELGKHSVDEHRKIGALVPQSADLLAVVGFRARDIVQSALDASMNEQNILQFEDAAKAGEELAALIQEGDCILVKGSQSMRMERVVYELMKHPEDAERLLVRQDSEWQRR